MAGELYDNLGCERSGYEPRGAAVAVATLDRPKPRRLEEAGEPWHG